jgi:SAM-dependent methyltransferase
MNISETWFETWFNSSYYHLLYNKRDDKEAQEFLDNLISYLNPSKEQIFLDLACGKGRHSRYLNSKGFEITGVDLSEESIAYAKQFENETLSFFVHDMRRVLRVNYFNYVLNLFTSFGYFESEKDDLLALKAMQQNLRAEGILVLDFMNSSKVIKNLVPEESKTINGIVFHVKRYVKSGFIIKEINVEDKGAKHQFFERVQALTYNDFEKYFSLCGLKILNLFGDYHLAEFDEHTSDRLILVAQKHLS